MAGKTKEKYVKIRLPLEKGQNAEQQVFVSVNFKNYIIKRGEDVIIPVEVAEALKNSEKADEAAIRYIESVPMRES